MFCPFLLTKKYFVYKVCCDPISEYGTGEEVDKKLSDKNILNTIYEGFNIYKKAGGAPSIKQIENEKELRPVDKVIIIRLAALLNLDEQQSKEIVKAFQKTKGKGYKKKFWTFPRIIFF